MDWNQLTFGVEIECYVPGTHAQVARTISEAGIPVMQDYGHTTRPQWKIVEDGSLRNVGPAGLRGAELVSPILKGEDGLEQVRKVCAALVAMGARVNTGCGVHVHVGAREASTTQIRNLCKLFLKYEEQFDAVVPASRRNNRYCGSNKSRALSTTGNVQALCDRLDRAQAVSSLANIMNGGLERAQYNSFRYHKLNLQSYVTHGTVEFRQHSGSIDGVKIAHWVRLVTGFVSRAYSLKSVRYDGQQGTFEQLIAKTDRAGAVYFRERAETLRRIEAQARGEPTPAPAPAAVARQVDDGDMPF
jgi:hypothetical protein